MFTSVITETTTKTLKGYDDMGTHAVWKVLTADERPEIIAKTSKILKALDFTSDKEFQDISDWVTFTQYGFELSTWLRWRDPNTGVIGPTHFALTALLAASFCQVVYTNEYDETIINVLNFNQHNDVTKNGVLLEMASDALAQMEG